MRSSRTSNFGGLPPTIMNSGGPAGDRSRLLRDVLPVIPEILRRERCAVGPAMARAQGEGEDPVVDVFDLLEDVGLEVEVAVIADEARIGVGRDVADVARARHEGDDVAAILAGLTAGDSTTSGACGRRCGDRRQFVAPDLLGEKRRLAERPARRAATEEARRKGQARFLVRERCEASCGLPGDVGARRESYGPARFPSCCRTRPADPEGFGPFRRDRRNAPPAASWKSSGRSMSGSGTAARSACV